MRAAALLIVLGALSAPAFADPPPGDPPERCGLVAERVPDFALQDVNPASPTYGTEVRRDDFLGRVLVIYFSQAT